MDKLNIAIADDNAKVLQLLDKIVSSDEELNVVGKAGNGEDLYDIIKKQEPDVVLLDLVMPKVDGLTVMERVNKDQEIRKHAGSRCRGRGLLHRRGTYVRNLSQYR